MAFFSALMQLWQGMTFTVAEDEECEVRVPYFMCKIYVKGPIGDCF